MKYILILLCLLTLVSCEYECDGLPESEMGWLPYKTGDSLIFTNGSEEIIFEVFDHYKAKYTSTTGLYMDHWCLDSYYKAKSVNDSLGILVMLTYGKNIGLFIDYSLGVYSGDESFNRNTDFNFNVSDREISSDESELHFIEDTTINDYNYQNVFIINNLIHDENIEYIITAENYGIIEFYDNSDSSKWNLVR